MAQPVRLGLIGFGYLGKYVYDEVQAHPEWGIEVVGVVTRSAAPEALPASLHYTDVSSALQGTTPDLVVEVAHAAVTAEHGETILKQCDYMPLSMSALADAALHDRLLATAEASGTTLYIPHGAATGLDMLSECRDLWDYVKVTMVKPPKNLDFTVATEFQPEAITQATTLFDGPTQGVCGKFPRNVNTHAAVALAGIGFDRTQSVLIADPTIQESIIEIEAAGQGVTLNVVRRNPLKGVSGILTQRSTLGCIRKVCGKTRFELV